MICGIRVKKIYLKKMMRHFVASYLFLLYLCNNHKTNDYEKILMFKLDFIFSDIEFGQL